MKLLLLSCILTGLSVYGQNKSAPVPNSVPAFNLSGQLTTNPVDLGLKNENPTMYEYKKTEQLKAGTLMEEERLISSESFSQVPKSRIEELQLKLSLTQNPDEIRIIEQELSKLVSGSNQGNDLNASNGTFDMHQARVQELQFKLASTTDESEIALINAELKATDKQILTSKESMPDLGSTDSSIKNKNISVQGDLIEINGTLYEKVALQDFAKQTGKTLNEIVNQIESEK